MSNIRIDKGDVLRLLHQAEADGRSPEVIERLQWFLHFAKFKSISRICEDFGIARTTYYRWAKRFDPTDLSTLEDNPRTPPKENRTEYRQPVVHSASPNTDETPLAEVPTPRLRYSSINPLLRGCLIICLVFNIAFLAIVGYRFFSDVDSNALTAQTGSKTISDESIDLSSVQLRITDCTEKESGDYSCSLSLTP